MEDQNYVPIGSPYVARQLLEHGLAGAIDLRRAATRSHAELVRREELAAKAQAASDAQVTEDTEARARRHDPDTSHKAAMKLRNGGQRAAVLRWLVEHGPATDWQITRGLRAQGSGPRTRRSELTELGYVTTTGRTLKINGHQHTIWEATLTGRDWASRNTFTNAA